jgi:hypothetical protein
MKDDPVNHPPHYTAHPSGVECIEVTRHMSFNIGNVIKYCWRSGLKDGNSDIQDLRKAAWYLNDEISRREKETAIAFREGGLRVPVSSPIHDDEDVCGGSPTESTLSCDPAVEEVIGGWDNSREWLPGAKVKHGGITYEMTAKIPYHTREPFHSAYWSPINQ